MFFGELVDVDIHYFHQHSIYFTIYISLYQFGQNIFNDVYIPTMYFNLHFKWNMQLLFCLCCISSVFTLMYKVWQVVKLETALSVMCIFGSWFSILYLWNTMFSETLMWILWVIKNLVKTTSYDIQAIIIW